MKNIVIMGSVAVLSLGLMMSAACSDETSTATGGNGGTGASTGGSTADGGGGTAATGGNGGGGMGPLEVPTLGVQIDRIGRPAINTATTSTFTDDATRDPAESAYNANDDPTTWATMYAADKAAQLGILDGLDETCGNQAFYGDPLSLGLPAYMTLATVLSNDWLVIDSTKTACGYLGVELELGGPDDLSCGGRMVGEDVMDATYGAVSGLGAFGDTVPVSAGASETTWPYLADPN